MNDLQKSSSSAEKKKHVYSGRDKKRKTLDYERNGCHLSSKKFKEKNKILVLILSKNQQTDEYTEDS